MISENGSNSTNFTSLRNETNNRIALYVGLFIVLENLFSFLILIRCKNILSQIRMLVLSLCFTDFLCGIIYAVPGYLFEIYLQCRIRKYILLFLIAMSILTASMLNADRFLSLYLGIQYYVRVTNRKIKVLIFVMPITCVVTTYLTFYDENGFVGISCASLVTWKINPVSIIGRVCNVAIVISNVFFYVGIVSMLKSIHQRETIVKISIITGSVLLLCTPGLLLFNFFPKTQGSSLYFYAIFPILVKCEINPFLYVWRFGDARYQLKKMLCFWKRKEIEAARKEYYSSYTINVKNFSHTDQQTEVQNQPVD